LLSPEKENAMSWEEGFVRTRDVEATLGSLSAGIEFAFDLKELTTAERARAPERYRGNSMVGHLSMQAHLLSNGLYRLCTTFGNHSPVSPSGAKTACQKEAFVSAHLLLSVNDGEFVSLLEPEEGLRAEVAKCSQEGVFPVLAGEGGNRSCMLCSPIILYDYPQVAPESTGDFFDGTEMDEMLALRVMTLTDEEKAEVRRADPYARAILERTEMLPPDHLAKLHGTIRGLQATTREAFASDVDGKMDLWDPFADRPPIDSVRVFGAEIRTGDRVRLWPQKKADIMDMAMEGKVAVIEAIEQDLEDQIQLAVVLEDDPGRDMGMLRQAGHRFFFSPEEIEPLCGRHNE
jgi:hypothetical protein